MSKRERIKPYGQSVMAVLRENAAAYGFTILVTGAYAVLSAKEGPASVLETFVAAGAAIVAFVLIEVIASRGFLRPESTETSEITLMASVTHFASVGIGIGDAFLSAVLLSGLLAWAAGGFAATAAYVLVSAAEHRLIDGLSRKTGSFRHRIRRR